MRVSAALFGVILVGCGGAPAAPEPRPAPPRDVGELTTLVPLDAQLVIVARPASLVAAPATARVIDALLPAERLDAFRARTGIDPRTLTELVYVGTPDGRLAIARGPIDAELAVLEAGERMAPLESAVDEPFPRRAGFLGDRRVELAAPAPDVVVWIDGPPQLSAAVLSAALRAEHAREHPFERGDLAEIAAHLGPAPFVAYGPRPLELPLDTGVGMLLAQERALGLAAAPASDIDALALEAQLRGAFPPNAEENFRALARSIAESDLGGALGARDAYPSLRIVTSGGAVRLTAEVSAAVLASGLRALLIAEMDELIDGPPTPAAPPSVPDDVPAVSDPAGSASETDDPTSPHTAAE